MELTNITLILSILTVIINIYLHIKLSKSEKILDDLMYKNHGIVTETFNDYIKNSFKKLFKKYNK